MRSATFAALFGALLALTTTGLAQAPKEAPKAAPKLTVKDTPAAALTRSKALRVKVSVELTDVKIGDVLKEFAHLSEEATGEPLMLAYGEGFPFAKKVTLTVKNQTLDAALEQVFTKAGGGLGYVVVSKDGDKYDGWVRLTTTGERGIETPPPGAAEEAEAATKLALAKKLIDANKPASAKPVLEIVARTYPGTKAGAEAKALLEKVEKLIEKDNDK